MPLVFKTCRNLFTLVLCLSLQFHDTAKALTADWFTANTGYSPLYSAMPLPDGKVLIGGIIQQTNVTPVHIGLERLLTDATLDNTFTNGLIYSATIDPINCLSVKPDGKIIVGGAGFKILGGISVFNIGQIGNDNLVDTNFAVLALMTNVVSSISCVIPLPKGKIMIAGSFQAAGTAGTDCIARLNDDGSIDTNFTSGISLEFEPTVYCVAPQSDGKILASGRFSTLGGFSCAGMGRLNPDGSLDSTFNTNVYPGVGGDLDCMVVQRDGKILVGGSFFNIAQGTNSNLARLNPDGTIDTGFSASIPNGNSEYYYVRSIALQTDGKIVIGGSFQTIGGVPSPAIARLNSDGTKDTNFGFFLFSSIAVVFSTAIQADGNILAGGEFLNGFGSLFRVINPTPATQNLSYDGTNITWLRGGSSPEVWRTSFEYSGDGTNWIVLADGTRISGGWQLTNVSIATNSFIRATGFATGGFHNGSCYLVQSVIPKSPPTIATGDGQFGFRSNYFGFNLSGTAGSTAVVQSSSNLVDWSPLSTNIFPNAFVRDTNANGSTSQFYRVVSQ